MRTNWQQYGHVSFTSLAVKNMLMQMELCSITRARTSRNQHVNYKITQYQDALDKLVIYIEQSRIGGV